MHVQPEPLLEQLLRDEPAVRDDHDRRRAEVEAGLEPLGLEHRDPEPLGGDLRRRRDELPPAAGGRVRAREQQR